jgi:hypothetical protein
MMAGELEVELVPTDEGLVLRARPPGVSIEEVRAATAARLIIGAEVPEMALGPAGNQRQDALSGVRQ